MRTTSDRKALPLDYMVLMRMGGAAMFLGAGWMIASLRRLLDEARDREGMLLAVFDSEPACVMVLGADHAISEINSAGPAMFEAESLEMVRGRSILPIVTPRDRERAARLGGMATVTSTRGQGSEVRARFPLAAVEERLTAGVEV
jgi:PAS domain-containing protein